MQLRAALDLRPTDVAPWIARMWQYGPPPGYKDGLVQAADEEPPSSITVYDGNGNVVPGPAPAQSAPLAPRQPVLYEGYNAPPQPGVMITDPRNPYRHASAPGRASSCNRVACFLTKAVMDCLFAAPCTMHTTTQCATCR
jgi:hypothetical protein